MTARQGDDPKKYLVKPEPFQGKGDILNNPYANPASIFDAMSPSWWINEIIKIYCGRDIVGACAEFFAGDWDKIHKYGEALTNAGDASLAVGMNIAWGNSQLDPTWSGNAADAASVYFYKVSQAHSDLKNVLVKIGEQYKKAAESTWRAADVVAGLIRMAIDRFIWAAAIAGAGSLISGGTATAAGAGVAALVIKQGVEKWEKASVVMTTTATAMNGITAEIQGLTGDAGELKRLPMPQEGYKHFSS